MKNFLGQTFTLLEALVRVVWISAATVLSKVHQNGEGRGGEVV